MQHIALVQHITATLWQHIELVHWCNTSHWCNTLVQHWCNTGATTNSSVPTQRSRSNQNDWRRCFHFVCQLFFSHQLHWSVGRRPVSEPDSELSARSDIPERSFLRAIKISYEIVLDAAWQVSRGPHTELNILPQEQF